MKVVKRRTNISIQPYRLEPITDEQIKAGIEAGEIEPLGGDVYQEVDGAGQTYMTRDMTARPKTVRKRVVRRRKDSTATEDE